MAVAQTSVAGSVERIQELTEHLEAVADPGVRALADELTTAVVQLYGAGLERMLELLGQAGAAGDAVRDAYAEDELVASLLLIHDLHPVPLEERVGRALERVRPYMESHGGDVEVLGIADGVVRLRLQGSCRSCRASSATLELAVRQALEELCPDLEGMDVEGLAPEPELAGFPGVALPMAGADGGPQWHDLPGIDDLAVGALASAAVGTAALVVANVDGTLLAYRDRCASCGGPLQDGELRGATLVCPGCASGFVLTRAGRSDGEAVLQIEPVPLLRQGPRVRVALEGR